jgi:transcription factor Dp-1
MNFKLIDSFWQQQYDEKNIRRRVYDALNVLMAMGIILKDKKDIQWKGLPSASLDDVQELKAEGMRVRGRIERKAAYLHELQAQVPTCFVMTKFDELSMA